MQALQQQVLNKQDSTGMQGHLNMLEERFESCKREVEENEAEIARLMD